MAEYHRDPVSGDATVIVRGGFVKRMEPHHVDDEYAWVRPRNHLVAAAEDIPGYGSPWSGTMAERMGS